MNQIVEQSRSQEIQQDINNYSKQIKIIRDSMRMDPSDASYYEILLRDLEHKQEKAIAEMREEDNND